MNFFDCPDVLYPLIPTPLEFKTAQISGKLCIEGDAADNAICFRFEFTVASETAPVLIEVESSGKQYVYYCTIRTGSAVSTPVFHPEFCVGRQFFINAIEPLVQLGNTFFPPKNIKNEPTLLIDITG